MKSQLENVRENIGREDRRTRKDKGRNKRGEKARNKEIMRMKDKLKKTTTKEKKQGMSDWMKGKRIGGENVEKERKTIGKIRRKKEKENKEHEIKVKKPVWKTKNWKEKWWGNQFTKKEW